MPGSRWVLRGRREQRERETEVHARAETKKNDLIEEINERKEKKGGRGKECAPEKKSKRRQGIRGTRIIYTKNRTARAELRPCLDFHKSISSACEEGT